MTCKHCRADRAIHRFDDFACPAAGKEARPGQVQRWLSTTYEEVDETPQLLLYLTERVTKLEKIVADQRTQLKECGGLARRMKQLEGWQSDLAVRLVNVDRKLQKKPPVRVKPVAYVNHAPGTPGYSLLGHAKDCKGRPGYKGMCGPTCPKFKKRNP